jgi:hypothetical protein
MSRAPLYLYSFLTIAAGCGTQFSESETGPDAAGIGRRDGGTQERDGGDGAAVADASDCDEARSPAEAPCTVDEKYGVFVSASLGVVGGDGTREAPLKSVSLGIALAAKAKKRVYVCAETYHESISLSNGVSMFGSFTCESASSWAVGSTRAAVNLLNETGVLAQDLTARTRVENFSFKAPDAPAGGGSSFAMRAIRASGLSLVNVALLAGRGGAGKAGEAGVAPEQRTNIDGSTYALGAVCTSCSPAPESCPTYSDCTSKRVAKPGGSSTCYMAGTNTALPHLNGGPGGTGGAPAIFRTDCTGTCAVKAVVAADSGGGATSQTSSGGTISGGLAVAGADGSPGADGKDGASIGRFSDTYLGADGAAGGDGAPGQGGGGGAASNSYLTAMNYLVADTLLSSNSLWLGPTGASGGAGGCAGPGGTGGGGGGASVALLVIDGAVHVESSELTSSAGGAGGEGKGGAQGTAGGKGASGWSSAGGGAAGGKGGVGGRGGHGGGGPSIGIVYLGPAPTVTSTTLTPGVGGESKANAGLTAKVYPQN